MSNLKSFDPNSFNLTKAAASHLERSILKNESLGIRFSVEEASGCSGYVYELDYVSLEHSEDMIFDCFGIKVFIDPSSFNYLKGTTVDFVQEGVNEQIKFMNPNVKAVCGCGESFEI
ncbi:MAG: HesB/IscA family protein [Gammaproteobacteria bacterium]